VGEYKGGEGAGVVRERRREEKNDFLEAQSEVMAVGEAVFRGRQAENLETGKKREIYKSWGALG
jgi:hypothetical protein